MTDIKFKCWVKDVRQFAEVRHIHFYKGKKLVKVYDQPIEEEVWLGSEDVELLQYTGLKDKNGVEIYEGDILIDEDFRTYEVIFDNSMFGCMKSHMADYVTRRRYEVIEPLSNMLLDECYTIGNIYESPELLTGGN